MQTFLHWFCWVMLLVGQLLARPVAAQGDSESVRALKEFLEHPPIIKSLTASQRWSDGSELYVEIRSQPGAFFVKTARNPADLRKPVRDSDGMTGGWWRGFLWSLSEHKNYSFEQLGVNAEAPPVTAGRYAPVLHNVMRPAGLVMNMGLPSVVVGSLRWDGSKACGTNEFGGRFEIELKLDAEARLAGAQVFYPGLVVPFDPHSLSNVVYSVTYRNTRQIPGWQLPTTIVVPSQFGPELEVLAVALGSEPASKWRFLPAPYLNRMNRIMWVSEYRGNNRTTQVMYNDATHGMVRVCGVWLGKPQLRTVFFLDCQWPNGGCRGAGGMAIPENEEVATTSNEPT